MRRLFVIAAICAWFGCGDDGGVEDSPAQRLDGQWTRDDALTACTRFLAFRASNGVAVVQRICELTDGTIGAEIYVGTFEADSDSISIYMEESSCADVSGEPDVLGYQIDGAQLALVMPDGLALYERSREARDDGDDGLRGGAVTFGCFDEEDRFTPRSVQPI